MSIDLAEYAQEGGLAEDSTLLKWIAHKVSRRSDAGEVKPSALRSWMRQWPWFLVLDGLDEVTEPAVRKRLMRQETEFVNEAKPRTATCSSFSRPGRSATPRTIAPNQFRSH